MRQFEVDHDRESSHGPRYELVAINHEVAVEDKDAADSEVPRLQCVHQPSHHRHVCVKLYLARAVKEYVIILPLSQCFFQPLLVLQQELHGKDKAPVWSKFELIVLHDIVNLECR